ncbi:MAG TPA: hypothetical protein VM531_07260 [Sphingomicrobium sp.]|jgi:hypothetical protein|nr:hypothetical protein [Sphingomicrobium sp.]
MKKSADTGKAVASLAGEYANFHEDEFLRMNQDGLKQLAADIRSMAASLLRQNER